jgi:tRNA(His) 5'-end guanylyltransferase
LPFDYRQFPGLPKRIWTYLGDLITRREHDPVMQAAQGDFIVLRLDIRSMKGLRARLGTRVYSEKIAECMRYTTLRLMEEFNVHHSFTQSDEITLVLTTKLGDPRV